MKTPNWSQIPVNSTNIKPTSWLQTADSRQMQTPLHPTKPRFKSCYQGRQRQNLFSIFPASHEQLTRTIKHDGRTLGVHIYSSWCKSQVIRQSRVYLAALSHSLQEGVKKSIKPHRELIIQSGCEPNTSRMQVQSITVTLNFSIVFTPECFSKMLGERVAVWNNLTVPKCKPKKQIHFIGHGI